MQAIYINDGSLNKGVQLTTEDSTDEWKHKQNKSSAAEGNRGRKLPRMQYMDTTVTTRKDCLICLPCFTIPRNWAK